MPAGDMADSPELQVKLETAEIERDIKKVELLQKQWDYEHPPGAFRSVIRTPVIIGAFITTLATAGATWVTYYNATLQRELDEQKAMAASDLERRKFEAQILVEAIKTGDPDRAATNIDFFLKSGLISDPFGRMQQFLKERRPGFGRALPPAN